MTNSPAIRHDGWTYARRRAFLEALAETGSVTRAAEDCDISTRSAYQLRHRHEGAAFALGWDAAILVARGRLVDDLMHRALEGQTDILTRDRDADQVSRTRTDNRLGMSLLTRLDNRADAAVGQGGDAALSRIIAQDFEAFLDLVESGAGGAGAALFVGARQLHDQNPAMPGFLGLPAPLDLANGQCELRDSEAEDEDEDESHDVWQDDECEWRTRFPPPPGFVGREDGEFGDDGYWRSLTTDEIVAALARCEAALAPIRAEAEAARDSYFGFVPPSPRDAKSESLSKKAQKARTESATAPESSNWDSANPSGMEAIRSIPHDWSRPPPAASSIY
jgi:hypothetical protein